MYTKEAYRRIFRICGWLGGLVYGWGVPLGTHAGVVKTISEKCVSKKSMRFVAAVLLFGSHRGFLCRACDGRILYHR